MNHPRAFRAVLLAVGVGVLGGCSRGKAAERTGTSAAPLVRWTPGSTIRAWIDPDRMPAGADGLVARALTTWTDAADGRLKLMAGAMPETADLRIHFMRSDGVFGETAPRVDPRTGRITAAEIVINADAPGDALDSRIIIYLTALHELGHALGLGHTDDFETIMYRFQRPDDGARFFGKYRALLRSAYDIGSKYATGLATADVRTLRELYDQ